MKTRAAINALNQADDNEINALKTEAATLIYQTVPSALSQLPTELAAEYQAKLSDLHRDWDDARREQIWMTRFRSEAESIYNAVVLPQHESGVYADNYLSVCSDVQGYCRNAKGSARDARAGFNAVADTAQEMLDEIDALLDVL